MSPRRIRRCCLLKCFLPALPDVQAAHGLCRLHYMKAAWPEIYEEGKRLRILEAKDKYFEQLRDPKPEIEGDGYE